MSTGLENRIFKKDTRQPRAPHSCPPRNGKLAKRERTPSPQRREVNSAPPRANRISAWARSGYEGVSNLNLDTSVTRSGGRGRYRNRDDDRDSWNGESNDNEKKRRRGFGRRGRTKKREKELLEEDLELSPVSPLEMLRNEKHESGCGYGGSEERSHSGTRVTMDSRNAYERRRERERYVQSRSGLVDPSSIQVIRRKPVGSGAGTPLRREETEGRGSEETEGLLNPPNRPSISRKPSSFPMREGETRAAGKRTLRFHIESLRQFPAQFKSHYGREHGGNDGTISGSDAGSSKEKTGFLSKLAKGLGKKKKKSKWVEVQERLMPAERAEMFNRLLECKIRLALLWTAY
jgi:hypothetical protein